MKNAKRYFSKRIVAVLGLSLAMIFLGGVRAHALTAPTNIITDSSSIVNLLCTALDWMFWFLIVLSVAMALVAGYFYATSSGDAEKVSKATKTLTYVAVAVVVALLAKGLPLIIGSFIDSSVGLNAC